MKKVLITLIMLLTFSCFASADDFKVNKGKEDIPLLPKKIRPKDVGSANESPTCWYADGVLTISFEEPEGRATLKVTRMDDGAVQSTSFYTISTFTYTMGTTPGTYVLNLKTSQCEYEGYLTIE